MRLDLNSNEDCQSFEPIIKKIKLENLSSWGGLEKTDTRIPITDYSTLGAPGYSSTPFYQSKDVNNRFVIWDGDITTLEVDAITNSADASLTANNPISKRIFAGAGIQLKDEINKNKKECQISEVQITKAYDLPAKYILHAVGPTCNEKLNSSAEKSLYCCYRNVLSRARELNLRTIALCVISQNIFAADLEAHIALRTTRHYLDKYTSQIVILCVPPQQRGIYEVLAPLYFPRDQLEERTALWHLPKDIAFDFSDTHHPDRQIRIIRNPQHSVMMRNTDDESDNCPHDVEDGGSDLEYGVSDLNGLNMSSNSVGSQSYRQMQGDLDRQLLLGDRPRNGIYEGLISEGVEGLEHQETPTTGMTMIEGMTSIDLGSSPIQETTKDIPDVTQGEPIETPEERYERLLRRAQVEDLNEISGIGCLYQSGIDRLGRPVIVFCGKWFPAHNIDLEKALLYLIKLLDPIVKGDYVITYFHTLTSANNYPSLQWLREVYSVLPYKYKKNLKAFYIVHPTFWTKMMTWWFTTFMAPAIKAKVHSLPGVEHLYSAISKDQLEIPAYITEYDMATNGLHYFTPLHTTS